MIAIVDYGVGNLDSVRQAFERVGAPAIVTRDPEALRNAERLVLPGVGAFGACMEALLGSGLLPAIDEAVRRDQKPLLGICVGMQILASEGEEGGTLAGLGWIPGRVRKLVPARAELRLPHMGWNEAHVARPHPVFGGLTGKSSFYFVHSYAFEPASATDVVATCDYGGEFVCAIARDNIVATQFHPEKSQEDGFVLLEGFARWKPQAR